MTGTTAYVRPLRASRKFMVSFRLVVGLLVVGLALVRFVPVARAEGNGRTSFLVGRLQAEDFRVRTNAALALGQTGDDTAVGPLCGALADSSAVVRQAVAVALERLAKPASAGCLKDRLAVETSDAVKRQIGKAL